MFSRYLAKRRTCPAGFNLVWNCAAVILNDWNNKLLICSGGYITMKTIRESPLLKHRGIVTCSTAI